MKWSAIDQFMVGGWVKQSILHAYSVEIEVPDRKRSESCSEETVVRFVQCLPRCIAASLGNLSVQTFAYNHPSSAGARDLDTSRRQDANEVGRTGAEHEKILTMLGMLGVKVLSSVLVL